MIYKIYNDRGNVIDEFNSNGHYIEITPSGVLIIKDDTGKIEAAFAVGQWAQVYKVEL